MQTKTNAWILTVFAALLAACGGGGGGGGGSPPPSPPPPSIPVATNAGGFWEGTSNTSGVILEFAGIVTEDGQARFLDENFTSYIVTNSSGDDGAISLEFTAIADFGFTFIDGSSVTTGTVTGTVAERSAITGSYSLATGESGTLMLNYDNIYERGSSLAKLEGMWDDNGLGTLVVAADGTFFEQDVFGCVYDGQVSIIDANYNAYNVSMTVSNCTPDIDGNYTGTGLLLDFLGTDDDFTLLMNKGDLVYAASLLRM